MRENEKLLFLFSSTDMIKLSRDSSEKNFLKIYVNWGIHMACVLDTRFVKVVLTDCRLLKMSQSILDSRCRLRLVRLCVRFSRCLPMSSNFGCLQYFLIFKLKHLGCNNKVLYHTKHGVRYLFSVNQQLQRYAPFSQKIKYNFVYMISPKLYKLGSSYLTFYRG